MREFLDLLGTRVLRVFDDLVAGLARMVILMTFSCTFDSTTHSIPTRIEHSIKFSSTGLSLKLLLYKSSP